MYTQCSFITWTVVVIILIDYPTRVLALKNVLIHFVFILIYYLHYFLPLFAIKIKKQKKKNNDRFPLIFC